MKQIADVLHSRGLMFADAGLLALQSSLERPDKEAAVVRLVADTAENCNRLAACAGALTDW